MPRFKVLAGTHRTAKGRVIKKDKTFESDYDMDKIFANKFELVEGETRRSGRKKKSKKTREGTARRKKAGGKRRRGRKAVKEETSVARRRGAASEEFEGKEVETTDRE